ncbi:uncharacterized protein LOC112164275 [Rosa chinensis]|uniref:uncharacterized protein LOC112164275 n=1 Tax=Rosa chinensis TaxID=74649 RepID=UPI000D08B201|nr:uncharacterized protein LOC112164275 [Rosa chinensis]
MSQYNGLTDPFIHMDTFNKVTNHKGFDDATLCHLFSETLDSEAMSWFFECPPGSIDPFHAPSNAVLSRFILLAAEHHNTSQLFSVKQGAEETLKAFVTRWRAVASRCRDLDKTMALVAFKQGLLKGPFLYHLNYNYPNVAYDHVIREAVLHVLAEFITYGETPPPPPTPAKSTRPSSNQQETTNKTPATPLTDKKREWQQNNYQSKRQKDQHYHSKSNRSSHGDNRSKQTESFKQYAVLTVLTASYEEIYDQCKDQISPPPPRKYPRMGKPRNTCKWCKYHEDSGHNTTNCNALKTAIKTLYRDGKLEQFKVR